MVFKKMKETLEFVAQFDINPFDPPGVNQDENIIFD
jgi:gamma-glutamylcysteine synthetase